MPLRLPRALAVAALVAATLLGAGRAVRAEDDAATRQAKYTRLEHEVLRAQAEKRYVDIERLTREQLQLLPEDVNAHYNLACALALQGKKADALANLKRAVELGFDEPRHLRVDKDLDAIRGEKGFEEVLAAAAAAREKRIAKAYEPPQPVKGVKTVEGDPAGGLRWRLRISPDASAKKPHRLVVWLHPANGSMNEIVEPLAAEFAPKGWALVVTTAKNWESWSETDEQRLLEKTLPDVAKVEGVDAARPVLLGFSAGGQMALRLWAKDPARFGGIVIDAAYPLDPTISSDPQALLLPPEGDAAKKTPFFVLVGTDDPLHVHWKRAEEPWRKAGVPLRVTYVPGGEHQWLFGSDEGAALLAWLGEVAAGKCPGAPAPAKPEPAPAMSEPTK